MSQEWLYCVAMSEETEQTVRLRESVTPGQALARRLREVRTLRKWSAQDLAWRCYQLGMPGLDRSAIANIENGRRQRVGVDEFLVLALALGVAPVHLLVPITEEVYAIAPNRAIGTSHVRKWLRGDFQMTAALLATDPVTRFADEETYRTQRPEDERQQPPSYQPPREEDIERYRQDLLDALHKADLGGWRLVRDEQPARNDGEKSG